MVLLGPPGSGKGTQAERLQESLGLVPLATGDLLRDAVSAGSDVGRRAEEYMERGDLVPDEIVCGAVGEALADLDGTPVVLDGFPRTLSQAEAFSDVLEDRGRPLTRVVLLDVPDDVVVERISGRDDDRADDNPETVRARLEVYHHDTEPLAAYYEDRGLLRRVDANGDKDDVTAAVRAAIEDGSQQAP